MLDHADHLPSPQRDALGVAFGLRAGDSPDRLLVGLAALSLMSEVAEERPLLCVIDDAQWLDHASAAAIGFVARRLLAEPVVVLVGTRGAIDEFARLPEIDVRGLRDGEVALEQLEAVRADALAGAPWRAELDLPKPSAELNQAISRMFREARTAMDTGREPPLDAVILAVRATHVGSPGSTSWFAECCDQRSSSAAIEGPWSAKPCSQRMSGLFGQQSCHLKTNEPADS
jgi:hypothetical protein